LPQATAEESAARDRAVLDAELGAARVPLATAAACLKVVELAGVAARSGNSNAVSDAGVAGLVARAAAEGAILNVQINLKSIPAGADKEDVEMGLRRVQDALEPAARGCLDAVQAALTA